MHTLSCWGQRSKHASCKRLGLELYDVKLAVLDKTRIKCTHSTYRYGPLFCWLTRMQCNACKLQLLLFFRGRGWEKIIWNTTPTRNDDGIKDCPRAEFVWQKPVHSPRRQLTGLGTCKLSDILLAQIFAPLPYISFLAIYCFLSPCTCYKILLNITQKLFNF